MTRRRANEKSNESLTEPKSERANEIRFNSDHVIEVTNIHMTQTQVSSKFTRPSFRERAHAPTCLSSTCQAGHLTLTIDANRLFVCQAEEGSNREILRRLTLQRTTTLKWSLHFLGTWEPKKATTKLQQFVSDNSSSLLSLACAVARTKSFCSFHIKLV